MHLIQQLYISHAHTCFAIRSCSGVNARPLPPPPPAAAVAAAGALLVADGRRRTPGDAPGAAPAPAAPPLLVPLLALPLVDENGAERASDRFDPDEGVVPLAPVAPLAPALPLARRDSPPSCWFCGPPKKGGENTGGAEGMER